MSEEIEVFEDTAGTSYESMLITTDSLEEFSQELSASLEDENAAALLHRTESNINKIQGKMDASVVTEPTAKSGETKASDVASSSSDFGGSQDQLNDRESDELESITTGDYLHDQTWLNEREHIFVLSSAGKPIYSLHGNEDKLATLFGVMQALVSVVHANQDVIMSIHSEGAKFVFLLKGPLILVASSRRNLSVQQIQLQLT